MVALAIFNLMSRLNLINAKFMSAWINWGWASTVCRTISKNTLQCVPRVLQIREYCGIFLVSAVIIVVLCGMTSRIYVFSELIVPCRTWCMLSCQACSMVSGIIFAILCNYVIRQSLRGRCVVTTSLFDLTFNILSQMRWKSKWNSTDLTRAKVSTL